MADIDCRSADEIYLDHLKRDPDTWNSVLRMACEMLRKTHGNAVSASFISTLSSALDDGIDGGLKVRKEEVSLTRVANMLIEEARSDPAMRFKAYLLDCCRDETVAMVARETDDTIRRIALDLKREYNAILSVTGAEPEEIDFESVAFDVLTETVKLAKADQAGARAAEEEDRNETEGEYDVAEYTANEDYLARLEYQSERMAKPADAADAEEDGDEADSEYDAANKAYTAWLEHQPESLNALYEQAEDNLQNDMPDGVVAIFLARTMKADFEEHIREIEAETDGDLSDLDAALISADPKQIDFFRLAAGIVRQVRNAMLAADSEEYGEECGNGDFPF